MLYALILYWIFSLVYCGAAISAGRVNNVSILVVCAFAPLMCWVMFGMRLARGAK